MKYTYKNIFAREYSGYRQIQRELEAVFQEIHGMRLTSWNCLPFDGIHYLEFGSTALLIWYQDKNHLKIQCGHTFLPEMKQDLPAFTKEKEYAGMELQDLYVLMGEEPMLCFSFSDAFFNPSTELLHQFVLSSRAAGHGIQSLRVPDTTPFQRISTERIPTTQHFRKVVENKETHERYVSVLDEYGKELIPPLYNDVELTSTEQEIYRISIRKQIPGGTDYDLFGICDPTGKELIPCIYPDLYYMANGYILVMDYRHKWWVLTEDNEAIFGPHPQGVDIYSRNREYLYYIEYNPVAQCEALGIYSIELRTVLTDANYIRIHYLGNDTFEADQIFGPGDVRHVKMDAYGKVVE